MHCERIRDVVRPDFIMSHKSTHRSTRTGLQQYETRLAQYSRFIITRIIFLIMVIALTAVATPLLFCYKYIVDRTLIRHSIIALHWEEIILTSIFAISVVFIQIFSEDMLKVPLHYLIKSENHHTYETDMQSYSVKRFIISVLPTFSVMFYYAFIKGVTYYMPMMRPGFDLEPTWDRWRGYFHYTHCAPFTCLDEVFLVLLATVLIKHVILRLIVFTKSIVKKAVTDYNQGKKINQQVPSWEREYRLQNVTEEAMVDKVNILVVQFALVTLVGAVFPLTSLFILVVNLCDIRYEARMFLLCRRRPLLLETTGLGVWTRILRFLAFLSIPTNTLVLSWTTKTVTRHFILKKYGSMELYVFNTMTEQNTEMYHTTSSSYYKVKHPEIHEYFTKYRANHFVPRFCWFPGLYHFIKEYSDDLMDYKSYDAYRVIQIPPLPLTRTRDHHEFHISRYIFFAIITVAELIIANVITVAISPLTPQLLDITAVEEKMTQVFLHSKSKAAKK